MEKFNKKRIKYIHIIDKILSIIFRTTNEPLPLDVNKIKNVLLIDFTGIGDCIMTISLLNVMKKYNFKVDYLGNKYCKDLLDDQNLIHDFLIFDGLNKLNHLKDWMINRKEIKYSLKKFNEREYDLIIEPRGDLRHIMYMHFLKSDIKVSYDYTGGKSLVNSYIQHNPRICHLVDDKLYFLEKIGLIPDKEDYISRLSIPSLEKDNIKKELHLNNKFIVGIHPGASNSVRNWDKYSDLIKQLNETYSNLLFLIFEGPNEESYIKSIEKDLKKDSIEYRISKTGIKDYRNRISVCDRFICNDSGAGHISSALGVKTFILFGFSDPKGSAPKNENAVIIENGNYYYGRDMNSLSLDFVFNEIKRGWKNE